MDNTQIANAQVLLTEHLGSLTTPQLNAIEDEDTEQCVGLQCIVPEVSTVLVMYGDKDFINAHLEKHKTFTVTWDDFTDTEQYADLEAHPVSAVGDALIGLMYAFSDGSDPVTVLPWAEEVRALQKNNEFSGVSGHFFPTVSVTNEDTGLSLLVRVAPVKTEGGHDE